MCRVNNYRHDQIICMPTSVYPSQPTISPIDDDDSAPSQSDSRPEPAPQAATSPHNSASSSTLEVKTTPPEENDDPSVGTCVCMAQPLVVGVVAVAMRAIVS